MIEASDKSQTTQDIAAPPSRRAELFVFSVIAALIWPVVAVGVVGGFGFVIWMYQIIFGPPGPPPH
jgi:nitrate reductase NapE